MLLVWNGRIGEKQMSLRHSPTLNPKRATMEIQAQAMIFHQWKSIYIYTSICIYTYIHMYITRIFLTCTYIYIHTYLYIYLFFQSEYLLVSGITRSREMDLNNFLLFPFKRMGKGSPSWIIFYPGRWTCLTCWDCSSWLYSKGASTGNLFNSPFTGGCS